MINKAEFIENYKKHFRNNDELQIVFNMGERRRGKARLNQVQNRFREISSDVFKDGEIWVLLVIWNASEDNKNTLINGGFDIDLASNFYIGQIQDDLIEKDNFCEEAFDDAEILYIRYENYSFDMIFPLVHMLAGFDLGVQDTINILAYFISFRNQPVFLNLYDDRGMELLSHDGQLMDSVGGKFAGYVLRSHS